MTTDIIRHGMTGMRQKWDEWHRNDGMRPSLRQPNPHLIQLILMSFVSFWHHPIAVYNGDDSLMTPKWGPRQDRSGQLSLEQYSVKILKSPAKKSAPFERCLVRRIFVSHKETVNQSQYCKLVCCASKRPTAVLSNVYIGQYFLFLSKVTDLERKCSISHNSAS